MGERYSIVDRIWLLYREQMAGGWMYGAILRIKYQRDRFAALVTTFRTCAFQERLAVKVRPTTLAETLSGISALQKEMGG